MFDTGDIVAFELHDDVIGFFLIKAKTYAACVINHSDLKQDSCVKEFLALKDCVQKAVRPSNLSLNEQRFAFCLGIEKWLNTAFHSCWLRYW